MHEKFVVSTFTLQVGGYKSKRRLSSFTQFSRFHLRINRWLSNGRAGFLYVSVWPSFSTHLTCRCQRTCGADYVIALHQMLALSSIFFDPCSRALHFYFSNLAPSLAFTLRLLVWYRSVVDHALLT